MKVVSLITILVLVSCSSPHEKPVESAKVLSFQEQTNFEKYAADNTKWLQRDNAMNRVVFMGNSITEGWPNISPDFFKNNPNYICRGISGQTTPQMLLRFGKDVLDLKPKAVVILAGINDIAQNTGPIPVEQIAENIEMMAALASYEGIEVVMCAVLPAYDFPWRPGLEPVDKVIQLNSMLEAYAASKNFVFIDYHAAMKDERNGLKVPDYTTAEDMVHPNKAGYAVMEELLQPVLDNILNPSAQTN